MFTMQNAIEENWTVQPGFTEGLVDGRTLAKFKDDGVRGQAYDRGYQCGLQEHRARQRVAEKMTELERLDRQWEWAARGNAGLN
jgi:hypothetical protein